MTDHANVYKGGQHSNNDIFRAQQTKQLKAISGLLRSAKLYDWSAIINTWLHLTILT